MRRSRAWKRSKIFAKNNHCTRCNCEMIMHSDNPFDPRLAVLENKYSYFDDQRHQPANGEIRYYLVCLECCRKREKEINDNVPVEIRQELSGAFPLTEQQKKALDTWTSIDESLPPLNKSVRIRCNDYGKDNFLTGKLCELNDHNLWVTSNGREHLMFQPTHWQFKNVFKK